MGTFVKDLNIIRFPILHWGLPFNLFKYLGKCGGTIKTGFEAYFGYPYFFFQENLQAYSTRIS